LYLLGGVDSTARHFSDVWRLHLGDGTWSLLSEGDLPPLRLPGVSWVEGTFYIFGGRGGDERFFDDLWACTQTGLNRLDVDGPTPDPRYGHSQVTVGGDIYVFGGLKKENGSHNLFGDLWRYDPDQRRWTLLSRDGPSPRYGTAMVGWDDELLVFGGRYLEEEWWFSDETWVFDLAGRTWTRLNPSPTPGPRYTPGVGVTEGAMYIYGGMESRYEPVDTPNVRRLNRFLTGLPVRNSVFPTFKPNLFFSDLWRFDRIDRTWERLGRDFGVPPLKTPIMGVDNTSLVVGFGNNLHTHYDEVWEIPDCV
jgi:hypothetical protein